MAETLRDYASEDEVPESLRPYYEERRGRWVPSVPPGEGEKHAEDVRRALAARDAEKDESAKLRREMESLRERLGGLDLDQLPDAIEAYNQREEIEQQKLIAEKRFEEAAERKYSRQIAELNRQIEVLKGEATKAQEQGKSYLDKYAATTINDRLGRELLAAGVRQEFVDALVPMLAKKWEIDPETLELTPIEILDGGKDKITATGSDGKPLTMKEQATTFVRDQPVWANPSSGSNATHQSGTAANGQYSIRRQEIRDNINAYEALKQKAAAAGQGNEVRIID